ncbi:MAG TPA: aspartyl protease family protein [Sphingomicrobium sp.]|jgi:hypothetical protein
MLQAFYALTALTASHGTCAWQRGEVLEVHGEVQTGGLTGRLERRVEIGAGRSFEADDLGIVVIRNGFDRRRAWSQDMSGGVHELNSEFARRLAVSMAWLDGRQGCAPSRRASMMRVGSRTEKGRRFAAWTASPPGGVTFELWYDARTGRLDRALFQMTESRLIRHFAGWRDIGGGRWIAFEQRDEFPEDEDETVRKVTRAFFRPTALQSDFARPNPPNDVSFAHGAQSTTVRFEDDHRTRIYIPVTINGKGPFLFELDNGGHDILTSSTAEALGLSGTGSFNSTGAGNAVSQSGIARVAEIRVGDAVVTNLPVTIRKFSPASNDRSPNPPRAGILGLGLFERFVVAIDPVAKTVTLSPFGGAETPPGAAIPLVFAEDAPLIEGSYAGHRGDFMLDTGNAGPTIMEDFWARPLGLAAALDVGVPRGETKVSRGTVGIGGIEALDELVSYYGPAERGSEYSRAVAGVYGEPLLSRFRSTYDYSRNRVWLEPLPGVSPLPFDRSGLSLAKADDGRLKVSAVMLGSPADEAGIRVGDVVRSMDGQRAESLSRADAVEVLRQRAGTPIALIGTFGGTEGSRSLMLRELLPR